LPDISLLPRPTRWRRRVSRFPNPWRHWRHRHPEKNKEVVIKEDEEEHLIEQLTKFKSFKLQSKTL
jgi:hypothetical protein